MTKQLTHRARRQPAGAILNMSPAVDHRITYDGDAQRRTAGGECKTPTQRDISHAIAVQTRAGSFITGDLICRVMKAFYGAMNDRSNIRALDAARSFCHRLETKRRRVPGRRASTWLYVIMSHRLPMMIQAADDPIDDFICRHCDAYAARLATRRSAISPFLTRPFGDDQRLTRL